MNFTEEPSVAIILVNWNGYDLTKSCVKSLNHLTYTNFSVILVDNGSEDKSVERLKNEFPDLTYLQNKENLGFTGGNNIGILYALEKNFGYVLLLNNDTVAEPEFLEPMVAFLEKNPTYGAAQPKILFEGKRNTIWNAGGGYFKWLEMTWSVGIGEKDNGQFDREKDTPWITGCCFLVKTSCIRQTGLLDNGYFAYYEDVDWSFRMKKNGFRLRYIPTSVVYHVVGASSISKQNTKEGVVSPIVHFYRIRNHLYLIRSHSQWMSFLLSLVYQSFKNLAFIFLFMVRGRTEKAKAVYKGYLDGLFNTR
jgi:GT2 family glycosyltransferase